MSRTRARGLVTATHGSNSSSTPLVTHNWYREVMTETSRKGPCDVVHIKNPGYMSWKTKDHYWNSWPAITPARPYPSLDWKKLPTSSGFNSIGILAELDDSIALFSAKAAKSLSYGSVTWGYLPMISDLKAILKMLKNLPTDLRNVRYEDTQEKTYSYTDLELYPGQSYTGTLQCKYRLTGKLDMSMNNEAAIWLDRLGFHPDIGTAWDLIPFSFVVDYLLPVGDFLDNMKGGGWVRSANFSGWSTCKWSWSGSFRHKDGSSSTSSFRVEGFERSSSGIPLVCSSEFKQPEFELPSVKEAFNMAYLASKKR